MIDRTVVSTPAKVNLFLSVGAVDASGYHPIRSLFQTVGLYDTIAISRRPERSGTSVEFDLPGIPPNNTVRRAVDALGSRTKLRDYCIVVSKGIPDQAGLGGGSSDAAAILRALNADAEKPLEPEVLLEVAIEIGYDVPFFLVGGRARVEGYGQLVSPLPDGPEQWVVIAQPSARCSTPEMYRRLDALRYPWREFPDADELYNDFERVAPGECLDLIGRLRALGARDAGLSGSGSAAFGRFDHPSTAEQCVEILKREGISFAKSVPTISRP